jgi:hypothetical protein
MTRTLLGRKALALLTLLALLLLLGTALSSAKPIKGKRSRLRTLALLDHLFEPESDVSLTPAHVIIHSSSSSGGRACSGKAKAKKKKGSTRCTHDDMTEDEDTEANSVDDACSIHFNEVPEPFISEGFHLGMNLGIDSSVPAFEALQNFLNSIVVDDLAACSSSGDHRSSPDGSIVKLDFDVDDDTVKCLSDVAERMGIDTDDCSGFNIGVSVIHDGLETKILVSAIIHGIQDRCNLIAELDGVTAVDELCAFYVGGDGMEGDDFTTDDTGSDEDEDEDFSGDIGGGGTFVDDTKSTDSGTSGDGDDATEGGGSDPNGDGDDATGGGSDPSTGNGTDGGNNTIGGGVGEDSGGDPDGDGDDATGGGSDPSTGNGTDSGNSTTGDGGDSDSDGVGGDSDNDGGNDGSDTPGGGTDGGDDEDDTTGSGGTGGDYGNNTTGGGSNTTDGGDVVGGDGGATDDLDESTYTCAIFRLCPYLVCSSDSHFELCYKQTAMILKIQIETFSLLGSSHKKTMAVYERVAI